MKITIIELRELLYDEADHIDTIIDYINNSEKAEKDEIINYLIEELTLTQREDVRNSIAYILHDIKCQKALKPLLRLALRPDLKYCNPHLLFALNALECEEYLPLLFPLLFQDDCFGVRWDTHCLIKEKGKNLSEESRKYCLQYLKGKLRELEDILEDACDIYENVLDGEPFWEDEEDAAE